MARKPLNLKLDKCALHQHLNIPCDKKIPASKLAIKPGDSTHTKKMKQFALNFKH